MLLGCPWEDTVGFRVLVMELWVCLLPAFEDSTMRRSHPSLLQGPVAPLSAWTDIRDSDQWGVLTTVCQEVRNPAQGGTCASLEKGVPRGVRDRHSP